MHSKEQWARTQYFKQYPKKDGQKAKRGYLHFDLRPPRNESEYIKYALSVTEPRRVARHSFWPFLRYTKISIKRKRDQHGNVSIKKKKRPIDYAAHSDSLIYSWYAQVLSQKYDAKIESEDLSNEVIAYRSLGKNNIDFSKEAADFLRKNSGFVALAFDISDFFGTISHDKLKERLCRILNTDRLDDDWFSVFKSIVNFSFVYKKWLDRLIRKSSGQKGRLCSSIEFRRLCHKKIIQRPKNLGKGIPQGSPISCVFANIYMLDLDASMKQKVTELNGLYRRYSDDILFIVPKTKAKEVELLFKEKIKAESLTFSSEKTERWLFKDEIIYRVDESYCVLGKKNFSYLGIEFSGSNYYLRHRGIARTRTKIVDGIKSAKKYMEDKKLSGLPGKRIWKRFGKVHGTFRSYRNRAFEILGQAKSIKRQYSDRKVESFLKEIREKYRG